jgi:hypothetical protein
MRRRRAVLEHVAEMAAAAAAMHLGAHYAVAAVGRGLDRSGDWIVEARPSGATLELLLRGKQRLPAAGAGERTGPLLVVERAAPRRLGAVPRMILNCSGVSSLCHSASVWVTGYCLVSMAGPPVR